MNECIVPLESSTTGRFRNQAESSVRISRSSTLVEAVDDGHS